MRTKPRAFPVPTKTAQSKNTRLLWFPGKTSPVWKESKSQNDHKRHVNRLVLRFELVKKTSIRWFILTKDLENPYYCYQSELLSTICPFLNEP